MQTGNRLSLAYLTVHGIDPVEQVDIAAAAGFDDVGLRIVAPTHLAIDYGIIGNPSRIREIRHACDSRGIGVLDLEVITLAPGFDARRFDAALDTAAELGTRFVQVVCEDADRARAAAGLAQLCAAAGGRGLRVALEFMRFRTVKTLASALSLVEEAGAPNAGVLVDAMHLARSGGEPADVAAAPPDRIAYMQLCDAPLANPPVEQMAHESRTDRLYPGEGELPLSALLDALPPAVPISVEVPRSIHADRTMAERAKLAADASRAWLAKYRSRSAR